MEATYYHQYRTSFATVKEKVIERESHKKARRELKDFNFVSANLFNFLPEIPAEQHEDIYLDILSNHALLTTATNYPELVDRIEISGDTSFLEEAKQLPAIFCTYHLGSYRSIIGFLAKAAIDFVLIVDTNTFHRQHEEVKNTVKSIQQYVGKQSFFELVDAERVDIAITLSRYLLSGISVVAYLDGNTGVGGIYNKNDQMLSIDFLDKQLYSRKGISTLSFATKRPIIPVISYCKEKESAATLHFYEKIDPKGEKKPREQYCFDTTYYLYSLLADQLKTYYNQWEGWFYLHKYLDFDRISAPSNAIDKVEIVPSHPILFNEREFGLFKMESECYIFQKRQYSSFKITNDLFESLYTLKEEKNSVQFRATLTDALLERLVEKRILLLA